MRRLIVVAALAMAAVAHTAAAGQSAPPAAPAWQIERPFAAGGAIRMDLSAGQYRIEGSPDAMIRIRWTTRDGDAKAARGSAEVKGTEADVAITGPSNGFSVVIAVPGASNLHVELSAGELTIDGVAGHKDVSAWAGKLVIGIGDAADYRAVSASVTAGEIRAEPFRAQKGGLFRSVTWDGKGRHELRVRLTAGEVILREGARAPAASR